MKIEGRWISSDNHVLEIVSCSKNKIFGNIKLTDNFIQLEKEFNGIILYKDDYEIVFCFGLNLKTEADNRFKYIIVRGELNIKDNILQLAVTKYHNITDKDQIDTLNILLVRSD